MFGASSGIAEPLIDRLSTDNDVICISRNKVLNDKFENILLEDYNESLTKFLSSLELDNENVSVINFIAVSYTHLTLPTKA